MDMNNKVLHTLEYHKIIDLLKDKASSEPGRAKCAALKPMTDLSAIEKAQQETNDAITMIVKKGSTSFGGTHDVSHALKSLEIGASLSAPELLNIASLLSNTGRIKSYSKSLREEEPETSLTPLFQGLEPLTKVAEEISRCILGEEEIADDASPGLKNVRRSIALTGERIHSQLQKLVNGSLKTYLQEAVITVRGDRYCVPVKAEYKSYVKGMIHDQSGSGSTYFIEPEAIVNLNNELRELSIKEKEEIEAVLSTLSNLCAEHTEAIATNQLLMTELDFIFARASLALSQNASRPIFNSEHVVNIRKGRHPLIDSKKVVPIDIRLGKDFDLLIITGPNTGGKTVSLKTLGLLTLMGQSGLHIPAGDRSELSVFSEVFADIGDEQSIEQSLSTFSSHMTSIVSILKSANQDSLCLFDELGAGTDPTEGAALAIAILDHLHTSGIRTVATTHYSELKVYALSTVFVENACCEFNVETLSPTYRLLIGVPGKSNAFAISKKLGLPEYIIDAASSRIGEDEKSFEDLLTDLEESRVTIEKERLDIASYKEEIRVLKERLEAKNERIDNSRDDILRKANEEAREILKEAKETADETIRFFQKAGPMASLRDMEKEREKLRGAISTKNEKLALQMTPSKKGQKVEPAKLKEGDFVKITSLGLVGSVQTLPDNKGNLYVQCGIMRSKVNVKDLIYAEEISPKPEKSVSKPKSSSTPKSMYISTELNLLGKTVDEALAELDKYLDDAYLAHLNSVRIVHGKGTGALRSAVQSHLKKVKYVKSFRLGEFGEGDAGVTIVSFKE